MDAHERQAYGKVIANSWTDEAYKDRLNSDPKSVLAEAGIQVEDHREIVVVHDTADKRHIVVPARPDELTEEHVTKVRADATKICC